MTMTPCFHNPAGCPPPYQNIPGYSGGQYPNTAQPGYSEGQYPNTAQPVYGEGQYPNTAPTGCSGGQYSIPSPQPYGGDQYQYPIYGQNVYTAQPGYTSQHGVSTSQGNNGVQYPNTVPPGYGVGQYPTIAPIQTMQPAYRPPETSAVSYTPPLSFYSPPYAYETYLTDCLPDCPRPPRDWEVISAN